MKPQRKPKLTADIAGLGGVMDASGTIKFSPPVPVGFMDYELTSISEKPFGCRAEFNRPSDLADWLFLDSDDYFADMRNGQYRTTISAPVARFGKEIKAGVLTVAPPATFAGKSLQGAANITGWAQHGVSCSFSLQDPNNPAHQRTSVLPNAPVLDTADATEVVRAGIKHFSDFASALNTDVSPWKNYPNFPQAIKSVALLQSSVSSLATAKETLHTLSTSLAH